MAHRGSATRPPVPEATPWMWTSPATGALGAIAIEGSRKGGTTDGTATATASETETGRMTAARTVIVTETATATGRGWTGSSKGTA